MNGCQYMRPTFTLPASTKTSDAQWDLSFMKKYDFIKKYDITEKIYNRVLAGETLDEVLATYRRV